MNRILIANRGEIAVRIIHACHDTGRTAIAVYADDDVDALFVQLADEAHALGGSTPSQTYLNAAAILDAAHRSHADAVHPGYGFLSENADFAQSVLDEGFIWIGPSPQTIRDLGDKVKARSIAAEVGAPMAPGTTRPVRNASEVVEFAQQHGLPLAIKAVHGGGGRGLRVVNELEDIRGAFQSAQQEALTAFGNGDCFIERFLEKPRHVEVQVLGDTFGNVVPIGTRDCSLQRRNQKLIEEAPAPFLDPDIERHLTSAAAAICRRAGYVGAGTVEFLVANDGTLSFMEVNTRIQVEHPVTELVTGIDLVQQQLQIAQGESIEGLAPQANGHAIELRINAEDPARGFTPFPGTITSIRTPSGPGVRFDTGVSDGSIVSGQFDSMLAKLVVHASTRQECILRARRALNELVIKGIPTVIPFDKAVLEEPDFYNGTTLGTYTRWIEEVFLPRVDHERLRNDEYTRSPSSESISHTWIELDGRRVELRFPSSATYGGAIAEATSPRQSQTSGDTSMESNEHPVTVNVTGTLVRWLVDDGALVRRDDPIAVIEAMKMETQVTAPLSGRLHVAADVGDAVEFAQRIGTITVAERDAPGDAS